MRKLLSILILLSAPSLFCQAWSTFIDSSRAIDWTSAGFTIPSYTVNCATQPSLATGSGAASANATSIQNSINSCDATHNVVNIPAGTYYYTSMNVQQGNVVIRGAGPNSTTIIPTTGNGCALGLSAGVCISSTDNTYPGSAAVLPGGTQQCLWTAGYSKGTTTLTLNTCPGGAPPVNNILVLDQANDTSDTGGIFICDSNTSACALEQGGDNDGRVISGVTHSQQQMTYVTSVSGSGTGPFTVTVSPGVYFSNVRTGQTPGAWWFTAVKHQGLENLTIDGATMSSGHPTDFENIGVENCYQCWVKNVRSINGGRAHVELALDFEPVVKNNYIYGALGAGSQSYAVEVEVTSAAQIENNIFQLTTVPVMFGQGSGNVIDYNFAVNDFYDGGSGQYLSGTYFNHNAGSEMNLFEGNNFLGLWGDVIHGISTQATLFRNIVPGWQTGKTATTTPYIARAFLRANNLSGNVFGQPGYHTQYQSYATSTSTVTGSESSSIYNLGEATDDTCSVSSSPPNTVTCDPVTVSSMMRWGNYDIVTAGTKWDSTEASPAAITYVNANFSSGYFGTLAHTLPASLYYGSTPSWWPGGKAWPPVGPDVSSGNVGICTGTYAGAQATTSGQCSGGTLSTAWASHVTSIPAQDCYLTTLNGPPDGTGGVLAFDASSCYSTSSNYTLTVTKLGSGTGALAGTNCSSGSYASGTTITCTESYSPGSVFIGWSGACSGMGTCSFSLTSNSTVAATFVPTTAQNLNMDDSLSTWKAVCILPGCDPGGIDAPASTTQTINNASPSVDGESMLISETTNATSTQTNALWSQATPTCDSCTNFVSEFYTNPAAGCTNASSLEFDDLKFNQGAGKMNMWGMQCLTGGQWQIANDTSGWTNTGVTCSLSCGSFHHIVKTEHMIFGDTGCGGPGCNYYDTLTIDGTTHVLNLTTPSETLPGGWSSLIGPQFQIDIGPTSGIAKTVSENLDEISFSGYIPDNSFTLTVSHTGTGTVTGSNCSTGTYALSTPVSCTATAGTGYTFTGWSGGTCSGTTNPCSFSISGNTTVTATFTAITTYTLTASTVGSGTITGTNCSSGTYTSGTTIGPCTATAGTGYTFTGWSGACAGTGTCTIGSLSSNSTITATFTINSYTLSTSTSGSGTGTITGCAGSHNYAASYTCTVTPAGGSSLVSVSGCGGSGTTSYTGTMPASNCTVTAVFSSVVPPTGLTGVLQMIGGTVQ